MTLNDFWQSDQERLNQRVKNSLTTRILIIYKNIVHDSNTADGGWLMMTRWLPIIADDEKVADRTASKRRLNKK
jgi:hypothetical protein